MRYRISYWCESHVGCVRRTNQDNYICNGKYMECGSAEGSLCGEAFSDAAPVFGVFDGLGGEERGEVAAYIAAKSAAALTIEKDAAQELSDFCQGVNIRICEYARENALSSAGTTAAMLAFAPSEIMLCNIGDSKAFLFSGGRLEQISHDHLCSAPYGTKPPLLQNLGVPPEEMGIEPYLSRGGYADGDVYLICSDGLTDMLGSDEIAQELRQCRRENAARGLLRMALERGGTDNISIIVCAVEQDNFLRSAFRKIGRRWQGCHGN